MPYSLLHQAACNGVVCRLITPNGKVCIIIFVTGKKSIFKRIVNILTKEARGKEATLWLVIMDSQSVKTATFVAEDKGIDGNKKINGRKRHIAVDAHSYPLAVYVGAANQSAGLERLADLNKQGMDRLKNDSCGQCLQGNFCRIGNLFWLESRYKPATAY